MNFVIDNRTNSQTITENYLLTLFAKKCIVFLCIFNHLWIAAYVFFAKGWLLVALDSNDWTAICLDRLNIGSLTEVVFWTGLTVML